MKELIEEEDLKLSEKVFEIQEVNGHDFLNITEEKLEKWDMPGGSATRLVDFAKECEKKN